MVGMTKKEKLYRWCLSQKVFSKGDVIDWGKQNWYLSAERRVREFVEEGKFKHIDPSECILRGLKGHMAYYEKP